MIKPADLPGLVIRSAIDLSEGTLRPCTWPPRAAHPIVVDPKGKVICRYRDHVWDLTLWNGKPLKLNFADGPVRQGAKRCSSENGALLRRIAAWWLYGPDAVDTPKNLDARVELVKPLFFVCSENKIVATDLHRHPRVLEEVATRLSPSHADAAFAALHSLWLSRESLGFELLDQASLAALSAMLPEHEPVQTAYIPPRIWTYQVLRLRECLDDFLQHREQIEKCFRFCLNAYEINCGSIAASFGVLKQSQYPFDARNYKTKDSKLGRVFHGPFNLTAKAFGIDGLLGRWLETGTQTGVRSLSNYLTLVSHVGFAYLQNFSLMRSDEGAQLRANCYSVERDALGDDIHLLGGITTKTIQDGDARWIVSPSAATAIESMRSIAFLRMEAAREDPRLAFSEEELANPLLLTRVHEPWASGTRASEIRKAVQSYQFLVTSFPKVFDLEQLRITQADLAIARQMTFGLDPKRFAVGEIWPLAWHQLRRTGAVNMLSTGLVSDQSLQYQLKHATRAMSRYYGQNYYRLKAHLHDEARGFYIREMYQSIAREFAALQSDRFVSPHGQKRKGQILSLISEKDHKGLVLDAQTGKINYRETFLGGCAYPGSPCPLGGISNISGCMGNSKKTPCEWVMLDREKLPLIKRLRGIFIDRLVSAPPASPLHESLTCNLEAAEGAINVLDRI